MKIITIIAMKRILLIVLLAFFSLSLFAQVDEATGSIKISKDKVKIDGKYYYIHIVTQGETLFSISKAYNVSQIELAMENTDIYLGLQVDQAIKIPIKDHQFISGDEDENYIYHIVRRRETLTSLTRKYKVTIQEILDANPGVDEGIRISDVVRIPKKRVIPFGVEVEFDTDRFIYHEVKPREGFYSLKRQYGVSEEVVRRFNADLVEDGLKLGTVLRIPRNPNDTDEEPPKYLSELDEIANKDSYHASKAHKVVCDTFEYNRWRDIYNIALILPFTNEPDNSKSIQESEDDTQNTVSTPNQENLRVSPQTANFLDFYQGALIALDSLKKMGLSVNINVYNTERSPAKVRKLILEEEGIRDAHLIIGPAFPECLQPIAEFALENRIPLVSPLSPNNLFLEHNPYVFQANPSFISQLEEFAKRIDLCSGKNLVLIHESDSTSINMVNSFKGLINQRISLCPLANRIHFKEVTYSPGSPAPQVQERISHSLDHNRDNLIIVPSNNEPFVSDLLGNLHTLSTIFKFPISIYGFPRWQRFRNVQIDYYYQLQLHLFTPFYVDYSKPIVKSFITNYRDAFRVEPSQYAFQGYDVMFYFLGAMKKYGVDFQFCLSNHSTNLLQSKYNFTQVNSVSGYENRSIYVINYTSNYDIIEIEESNLPVFPLKYISEPGQDRKEGVIIK